MMNKPEFAIASFSYDEDSGGIIALHLLCSRLIELGYSAAIVPLYLPDTGTISARVQRRIGRYGKSFRLGPFNNPTCSWPDASRAVVVYPEVVDGNPVESKTVARWLLHKPGHHTGRIEYGKSDLFFFYQDAFAGQDAMSDAYSRLSLTYYKPVFRDRHMPRSGSCHMWRKGKGKPAVHPSDSMCLDGMSDDEVALVFNTTERFYCYDEYTMYATYAAICGCAPLVVPSEGLTVDTWMPTRSDRLGLGFGVDDEAWARETRSELLEFLQAKRLEEDEMVERLVEKARSARNRSMGGGLARPQPTQTGLPSKRASQWNGERSVYEDGLSHIALP